MQIDWSLSVSNRTLLFVQSHAPHGSLFGQEGLDAIMMGSAFARCTVLMQGDGIYQLIIDQDPTGTNTRDYSVTYSALRDYGVESVLCVQEDLTERRLSEDDLIIPVSVVSRSEVPHILATHDVILDF